MNPAALITGGSRGIGRGIALELAAAGWDLLIGYRANVEAAEEAAQAARQCSSSTRVEICQADLTLPSDRARLLAFMKEHFGVLDLLVNNAGIAPAQRADLLETSEESFDQVLAANTKAPFFLTQQAARWMIAQTTEKPDRSKPQIITISSVSAYTASVNRGEYCISKAALSMLTPLFAARLAEHGIQVFEIRPGVIATDMTAGVKDRYDKLISEGLTPIPRWGTPEDVGRAVVAIARRHFPFSTGEVFNVDGGFHLRRL